MRQASEMVQRAVRRKAEEALTIFDMHTGEPIGKVLDMSAQGMKLESDGPVDVNHIYYCRLPLANKIQGRKEIFFDAECRWCRKIDDTERYTSGYKLRFPSQKDAETIKNILRKWMAEQNERLNTPDGKTKKKGLFGRILKR